MRSAKMPKYLDPYIPCVHDAYYCPTYNLNYFVRECILLVATFLFSFLFSSSTRTARLIAKNTVKKQALFFL